MQKRFVNNKNQKYNTSLIIFLASIPFLSAAITSNRIYPADLIMNGLFLFAATGAFLIYLLRGKKLSFEKIPSLAIPLVGLVVLSIISLFWAHNTYEVIINSMPWFAALFLAMFLWQWDYSEKECRTWILIFIISASLVALIGIFQHLFDWNIIIQVAKPASTFINKNMASQYVMSVIPISLMAFFYLRNEQKKPLWINTIGFAFMTAFILYTSTRAAWLTYLVVLVVLVLCIIIFSRFKDFKHGLKGKFKYLGSSIILTLVLIHFNSDGFHWFIFKLLTESSSIVDAVSLENKGEARFKLFANSLVMAKENWMTGVGAGQWRVFYGDYLDAYVLDDHVNYITRASYVHNGYIQIFSEYGLLGLLLTLIGLISITYYSWTLLRSNFSFLSLGIVLSALAILVQANFSFSFHLAMPVIMLTFWVVLLIKKLNPDKGIFSIPSYKPAYVVMTVVALVVLSFFNLNTYSGKKSYFESRVLLKQKNNPKAYKIALEAIDKTPSHRNAHVILYNAAIKSKRNGLISNQIQKIVEKYPYDQSLLFVAAEQAKLEKDFDKSLEYYLRLADIFKTDGMTIKRVGDAYRRLKDFDNMKTYYENAIKLDPSLKNHSTVKKHLKL